MSYEPEGSSATLLTVATLVGSVAGLQQFTWLAKCLSPACGTSGEVQLLGSQRLRGTAAGRDSRSALDLTPASLLPTSAVAPRPGLVVAPPSFTRPRRSG